MEQLEWVAEKMHEYSFRKLAELFSKRFPGILSPISYFEINGASIPQYSQLDGIWLVEEAVERLGVDYE